MSGFSNSNAIRSDTRLRHVILLSSNEHVDSFTTGYRTSRINNGVFFLQRRIFFYILFMKATFHSINAIGELVKPTKF